MEGYILVLIFLIWCTIWVILGDIAWRKDERFISVCCWLVLIATVGLIVGFMIIVTR